MLPNFKKSQIFAPKITIFKISIEWNIVGGTFFSWVTLKLLHFTDQIGAGWKFILQKIPTYWTYLILFDSFVVGGGVQVLECAA